MSLKQQTSTPLHLLKSNIFIFSMFALIYFGWLQRTDNYLSAESGAGYLLGIVGGSLMIILLLYPMSKRVALFRQLLPIRYWFGAHMMLGVIGPVMILFHSNFHLGSTNSSIALVSMLLVAGSGLVGRYIYTRIHHGLYGVRVTLKELKNNTENNHSTLLKMYATDDSLDKSLNKMEEKALQEYSGVTKGLLNVIYLGFNAKKLQNKVVRLIKENARKNNFSSEVVSDKEVIKSVNRYTFALRQAAAFKVYEQLFSLWHVLHLPLFFMMIITAVIHIFAVHLY